MLSRMMMVALKAALVWCALVSHHTSYARPVQQTFLTSSGGPQVIEVVTTLVPSGHRKTTAAATEPPVTPGLHLLFHNDLDWTTTDSHRGWLLVSKKQSRRAAAQSCEALGETLAVLPSSSTELKDLSRELAYQVSQGILHQGERIWLGGSDGSSHLLQLEGGAQMRAREEEEDQSESGWFGMWRKGRGRRQGKGRGRKSNASGKYKALCTQSAKRNTATTVDDSTQWQVVTRPLEGGTSTRASTRKQKKSKGKAVKNKDSGRGSVAAVGYRDALSFRFHGLPFANPTERFAYSTVYTPPNDATLIDATASAKNPQCPQGGSATSEDCLALNLWTPYLPSEGAKPTSKSLKPVMVWFFGGGFNTGSGDDATFDGGQLSSRGDVVVVTPNYRVGTFGFLPVNQGDNAGNYAVGDCITALRWVQKYAKTFGGDPSRVTIFGQSAGGRLVETLIGSPEAEGLFHRAILQSDPLGREGSEPQTPEEYASRRRTTIKALGCDPDDSGDALLECLREPSTSDVLDAGSNFNKLTVDGKLIATNGQAFRGETGHVNDVPTIVGYMRDEEASLGSVPSRKQTDLEKALRAGDTSAADVEKVVANPDLFPTNIPHGLVNLTVEVHTDTDFRCNNEALAYGAVSGGHLTKGVWFYTQDQRAWQIPNYDPNKLCQPEDFSDRASAGNSSSYFFCHSGDLLPTFGTAGYEFDMAPRDNQDLLWIRNQIDQWTAFARGGDPNPKREYQAVRGYGAVSGDAWPRLDGQRKKISLGPVQRVEDLAMRSEQCALLRPDLFQEQDA